MKTVGKIVLWGLVACVLLFLYAIFGPRDEATVAVQKCMEETEVFGRRTYKYDAEYRMRCMEAVREKYGEH